MKKRFVVGNWKMHPSTLREAREIVEKVRLQARFARTVQTVLCPPAPFLGAFLPNKSTAVAFGSQGVYPGEESEGAVTGGVSAAMLASLGATYAIIGHSEERARGLSDADVNKEVLAALKAGLVVVLCVGEKTRDDGGQYFTELLRQLTVALSGVTPKYANRILVAYEPVWAISTSAHGPATPKEAHEAVLYLRKVLVGSFGRAKALALPMLYGGSVTADTVDQFLAGSFVQGFLVGRESLSPEHFIEIIKKTHGFSDTARRRIA